MKEKQLKQLNIFAVIIYVLTLIYAFIININGKYMSMCFVAAITPFIAPLFFKIIKVKIPQELYLMNTIFIYFASLIGSCLGGYSMPYYDKFTHCLSGVVIAQLMYILYKHYLRNDNRKMLLFLFVNGLNAFVAVLWEFYEYALLLFFNYDAIRHYATGVHDTVTDMLVAVIGGLVLTLYLIRYDQSSKEHFFVSLERKVYLLNEKKENI